MSLEQLALLTRELPSADKLRLIQIISGQMLEPAMPSPSQVGRPAFGALAHLGKAPSAEQIDEMQREVWGRFPREDG